LEKYYENELSLKEAGKLALESINLVSEEKIGISHIKMSFIENENKIMRKVTEEEIDRFAKIEKKILQIQRKIILITYYISIHLI
jgi:20S proteasome alpha/beta subunit